MYHRKDPKRIKMDEFAVDINFKYGIPMIILDLIYALTGYDIISVVKKDFDNKGFIQRMNPDLEEFQNYQNNILEEQQEFTFSCFDDLAELDLKKIQEEKNHKM